MDKTEMESLVRELGSFPPEAQVLTLLGVLEDVSDKRNELQARIDAYEGAIEEWEEMDDLIKASSLGTPEAEAVRARTPRGVGKAIVLGANYLVRAERAEAECRRLRAAIAGVLDGLAGPESEDAVASLRSEHVDVLRAVLESEGATGD